MLLSYDQLNLPNLAAAEMLGRFIQVVAEKRRERFAGAAEGPEERHLVLGGNQVWGNLPICPPSPSGSPRSSGRRRRC